MKDSAMFDKRKSGDANDLDVRPEPIQRTDMPKPMSSESRSGHHSGVSAVIGKTIKITGDVTGDEDLIIEGRVEGTVDLRSNNVMVGESGHVQADVTANVVRIDGEVKGDVKGIEKVVISKSGRVRGNVIAPRVTLEDGAKFQGSIDMDPNDKKDKPARPAPQAAPAKPVEASASKPAAG
jgi:cytoskeletal protein CcmA (bactofilin family)